jgi:peptidoglycan/LPS O-acetylase OafA/YrhL
MSAYAYRPDIDGLRAIAVIPVVFFHAGIPGFAGGYVGVDVFFVISGYLITQVLMRSGPAPLRSVLAGFYLRRARRILPALNVMLALVTVAAALLLLPADLERFGRFLALASAFLGNLAGWLGGGYFDTAGASLVHLWSLGIEEQFYLLYPLIFLAWIRDRRRAGVWWLALMAAASLGLCTWASFMHPSANFYAPLTRAWELLGGAALAFAGWQGFATRALNEAAAAIALVGLAVCFALWHRRTHHPGLVTLLPCAATGVLLATGAARTTRAAVILRLRPLVYVGLISYSLYLWHAPMLSLARYFLIFEPSKLLLCAELLVIFTLAAASWRWVEQPVRRATLMRSDRRFVLVAAASTAGLCLAGVLLTVSRGWPERFDARLQRLAYMSRDPAAGVAHCMRLPIMRIAEGDVCRFGAVDGQGPKVMVWGDSHALALLPAYRMLAERQNLRLYFAARSACRPLGERPAQPPGDPTCRAFNEAMLAGIERIQPDVLVLNAFWNLPESAARGTSLNVSDAPDGFEAALRAVVSKAAAPGRHLCAVLTVPVYSQIVPYALAMAERRNLSRDFLLMSRSRAHAQHAKVTAAFRDLERDGALQVVDPTFILCPQEHCRLLSDDGWPLYNDSNHLSPAGARLLVGPIARCVDPGGRSRQTPEAALPYLRP